MVRSLSGRLPKAADGTAPRIVIGDVQNETHFMIDKNLFVKRMRAELNKQAMGRITFLAREDMAAVEAERKAKREGQVTSSGEKAVLGADYLLTGTLSGLSKAREGDRSDYLLSTFRLTDLESSAIVWEDSHEMKRVGEAGVIYK
jgi:PBP1b-binding outer membrane lipoprotein LpoB